MPGFAMRRARKTPTILQMECVECGAASLAMVLAHYGLWIPLENVRLACGVSRDGTKASNILKAARSYGFVGKGFRKEPETLPEVPMPCIIFWNFNHFVVLEGIDRRGARINDPAVGRRFIDHEEFNRSFTGVVLALQPGPDFRPRGRKPAVLPILARELARLKPAVALLVAISIALAVPAVVIPAFSKIFVDDILVRGQHDWFAPLIVAMAVAAVGMALVTAMQQSLLLRMQVKLSVSLVGRLLNRLLSLPMEFFTQRHAGDLASRVSANEQVARLLSGGLATNALNVVSLVFFAAAMAAFDPMLAALCVGLSLMNVVALRLVSGRLADLNRGLAVERGKLYGHTVSIVRTVETLKASGLEHDAFARWAGFQAKVLNLSQRVGAYATILNVFPPFFMALVTAAILGVGGARVIGGELTIGSLVALQALAIGFAAPIAALVQFATGFQEVKADLARVEDVLNYPTGVEARPAWPAAATRAKLTGRIELRDIVFGYSRLEAPLIKGLSLTLAPGMRVALVGRSGSGKSTVGRLICGLTEPWSGEILFDGEPLNAIPPAVVAHSIAYVDQDIFLFEGTVRENLTLWDSSAPEGDLTAALKDALIHDEVTGRQGGYDARVAEGGTNFSGGQRQRIEIARALVTNPTVLVLDEATAALDPYTEARIDDNLRRRGCACIVIAHRLSTIRDCDEIILLENGEVVERGAHDELIAMAGAYARLVGGE